MRGVTRKTIFLALLFGLLASSPQAEIETDLFTDFDRFCLANADALPDGAVTLLKSRSGPPEETPDGQVYRLGAPLDQTIHLSNLTEGEIDVDVCLQIAPLAQTIPAARVTDLRAQIASVLAQRYGDLYEQPGAGAPDTFMAWRVWQGDLCVTVALDSRPAGNDRALVMILTATRKPPPDMDVCQPED